MNRIAKHWIYTLQLFTLLGFLCSFGAVAWSAESTAEPSDRREEETQDKADASDAEPALQPPVTVDTTLPAAELEAIKSKIGDIPTPVPIRSLGPGQGLMLEDFSQSTLGEFPMGWRPKAAKGIQFYRVVEKEGLKYLEGEVWKDASSAFREVQWDLKKTPFLEWRWRARVLPEKGNEKHSSTNDCSVAIYVVFPVRWFVPDTLKYSWSTTLPIGTKFANGMGGKNKTLVLETADALLNHWVTERRNVYEDYKERFRRTPPNPIAIGIITDGDNTRSHSAGDYAWFKLLNIEEAKNLPLTPPLAPVPSPESPVQPSFTRPSANLK